MKKLSTILLAFVMILFTQCKPEPETSNETNNNGGSKVTVRCSIPLNNGGKTDFTNLMEDGTINWSDGIESLYLCVPGLETTVGAEIVELVGFSEGNHHVIEFSGEVTEGHLEAGKEYDVWYFGNTKQTGGQNYTVNASPQQTSSGSGVYKMVSSTTSCAYPFNKQSGKLEDLGKYHIASAKVKAVQVGDEIRLDLNGTLKSQVAIAVLDLTDITKLKGSAIKGTAFNLNYDKATQKFEFVVTASSSANISITGTPAETSYIVLYPTDGDNSVKLQNNNNAGYYYNFRTGVKANRVYYRAGVDGSAQPLPWTIANYNNHEYVDLGLPSGLKWAKFNVGAKTEEGTGGYYSWAETATKENYSNGNGTTNALDVYNISGNAQYDAATANMGGTWRMPTMSEYEELIRECTMTWETVNEVQGVRATGPNGNSIFIPGLSYMNNADIAGGYLNQCYYWAATSAKTYQADAFIAKNSNGISVEIKGVTGRYLGRQIRAVSE